MLKEKQRRVLISEQRERDCGWCSLSFGIVCSELDFDWLADAGRVLQRIFFRHDRWKDVLLYSSLKEPQECVPSEEERTR